MGDRKTMRVSAIVLALVLCLARANEYDFDNDVPEELLSRTEAVVPEEMLTQGLHSVRYKGAAPDVDLSEVVEWSLDKNAKYDYGEECFEKGRWEPCDKYGKSREGWECEIKPGVWEPCVPKKKKQKKLPKKVADKRYLTSKPTFYKHCNYGGYAIGLTRSTKWVVKEGIKNDDLSALKVPQGYTATIYQHHNFQGAHKTFKPGKYSCLVNHKMQGRTTWNDQISSIKIAKTKRRCGPTTRQFCRCGRVMKDGCATSHCKKCKPKLVHPKPKRYDGSRGRFHVRCPMGRALCRGRKTVKKSYMFHGKKCFKYSCGARIKCPKCKCPKCKHYGEELVQTHALPPRMYCRVCACRACVAKPIVRCPVGRPFCRGRKTVKRTYMYHGKKCVKYSCGARIKKRCGPTTRQFCPCGRVMKNGCAKSHCKKCKPGSYGGMHPKPVHPKPKRYDGSRGRVRCPMGRPNCRGRKTVKRTYMYRGKKCVKYSCGGRRMDGGRGRYMERERKARKKATEKRCASKWRCGVSGLSTPVAIHARTGDVQCMSTNGKDCWWGRCRGRKVPRHGRLRPLVCGAHHKKMWGGTGYNNKHHWCNKVKKPVAKMCKQRKWIRRPLRRRL